MYKNKEEDILNLNVNDSAVVDDVHEYTVMINKLKVRSREFTD